MNGVGATFDRKESSNREIVLLKYNGLNGRQRFGAPVAQPAAASQLKDWEAFFDAVASAFPDFELKIDDVVNKGDRVLVRYTITGTQTGLFVGIKPTNAQATISGIDVFELAQGKIVEYWDAAHQMNSLSTKPANAGNSLSDGLN